MSKKFLYTFIALAWTLSLFCAPDPSHTWELARAHEQYARKDYARAQTAYEKLVVRDPNDPQALLGLANTFYAQEKFDHARNYYEELANKKLPPQEQEHAWFNLGCACAQLRDYPCALNAFERALKINSKNIRAKKNYDILKKLLEQQKQSDKNMSDKPNDPKSNKSDHNKSEQKSNDRDRNKQQGQPDKDNKGSKQERGQKDGPRNDANTDQRPQDDPKRDDANKQASNKPQQSHNQAPDKTNEQDHSNKKPASAQLSKESAGILQQVNGLEKDAQRRYIQALASTQTEQAHGW